MRALAHGAHRSRYARRAMSPRRRRAIARGVVVVVAVVAGVAGLLADCAGDPAPVPAPTVTLLLPATSVTGGTPSGLAWPAPGEQAAVGVAGIGLIGENGLETPVPIASVTKVMTAYIVLHDHPLGATGDGPSLTMTGADASAWMQYVVRGDSEAKVIAGERLTERELLTALLVPSADNVADILARWDAGSLAAFVLRMNATARQLGMRHTTYADASGLDPADTSTAADQIRLAGAAMSLSAFATIVQMRYAILPVAGWKPSTNPMLDTDGTIGVKTGFTQPAGGCLVFAAPRQVGGRQVMVLGAILGRHTGGALRAIAREGVVLLDSATVELEAAPVVPAGVPLARVHTAWGASAVAGTPDPPSAVLFAGVPIRYALKSRVLPAGPIAKGTPVGTLFVRVGNAPAVAVTLRTDAAIAGPHT